MDTLGIVILCVAVVLVVGSVVAAIVRRKKGKTSCGCASASSKCSPSACANCACSKGVGGCGDAMEELKRLNAIGGGKDADAAGDIKEIAAIEAEASGTDIKKEAECACGCKAETK